MALIDIIISVVQAEGAALNSNRIHPDQQLPRPHRPIYLPIYMLLNTGR